MTLVLVAAVLPRALADPGDGGPLLVGSSGEVADGEDAGVLAQTGSEQAKTDTATQPLAAVNTDTDGGGDGGATPPVQAHSGQEHAQPPTDVAQAQTDQTPDGQAAGVPERDDQAGQVEPRHDDVAACADGCSTQPPDAGDGDPTLAAAGTLRGVGSIYDRVRQALARRQPQAPTQAAPQGQLPETLEEIEAFEVAIDTLMDRQRAVHAEGATRSAQELIDDTVFAKQVFEAMREASRDPALGRAERERLQELAPKIEAVSTWLYEDGLALLDEGTSLGTAEWHIRLVEISQRLRAEDGRAAAPFEDERGIERGHLRQAFAELHQPRSQADAETETPGRREDLTVRVLRASNVLGGERSAYVESTPMNRIASRVEASEGYLDAAEEYQDRESNEYAVLLGQSQEELDRALNEITKLQLEQTEETPESDQRQLEGLTRRFLAAQDRQQRLEGENPMGMVRPDEVAPGQPTANGNQVAVPKPAGFGGNQPEIPNQTVFTAPKRDTTSPGLIPPVVDNTNPPYTATSAQAVGGGRLAAVSTELAPVGFVGVSLAVLLSLLTTVGCTGKCAAALLGPAVLGFRGVPGELQG
jgi:hypothetical protein